MMKRVAHIIPIALILVVCCAGIAFMEQRKAPEGLAPEITMTSPKGKKLKLSKLRGKMVLIDFWASWCGPCRKEMPNVVEAYAKYSGKKFKNAKGFRVFSVSLDREASAWKEAIKSENMTWKYHGMDQGNVISDLYGVNFIPSAFLVDGNGEIIAKGDELRGINLHITLDKYLDE
ncbi:MAG: TlpA family protein disulfide reductase [Flavobacteriia bacterium]|nr:TlpA family protein disulfide reductase [Flavobacteriia bacterium]